MPSHVVSVCNKGSDVRSRTRQERQPTQIFKRFQNEVPRPSEYALRELEELSEKSQCTVQMRQIALQIRPSAARVRAGTWVSSF